MNLFTLCSLRNYAQAEHIIVLGNGIDARLDKVNSFATHFASYVAIQLKSPPCYDGAESVKEHPQGSKGNAHEVMCSGDLTAKHNK